MRGSAGERRASRDLSLFGLVCAGKQAGFKGELLVTSTMLTSYADESGIHDGAADCVLAGYVASRRQWLSFEPEWQLALSKLSAPIKEFHGKFFFPGEGDYRKYNVSDQERLDLLDRLLTVIERHDLHAFGVGVNIASFNALSWGERAWLTMAKLRRGSMHGGSPSSPYHLCFMHATFEAIGRVGHGKTVDFFFARQAQFMGLATKHFEEIEKLLSKEDRNKIGALAFTPTIDTGALQASDLLAHCCYNYFANRESMPGPSLRDYALQRCRKDLNFKGWTEASFETLLSGTFTPEDRERLKAMRPPPNRKKGKVNP